MALGVMLVVSVLSIHGLISDSFRSNSSFGYNILVGARGGGLQLTMNTVYYLSKPVENIPYEYYLAFCDQKRRGRDMTHSLEIETFQHEMDSLELCWPMGAGCSAIPTQIADVVVDQSLRAHERFKTGIDRDGLYRPYTQVAIPMCLGDSYKVEGDNSDAFFRCVGTTPEFFSELELDVDTGEKFQFAEGRCFEPFNEENGYFECVIGALVARKSGKKIGDLIYATHGDPNDSGAHLHERGFKVVGILKGTRSPHDRAVFLNMEGFYLMEGHLKPIEEDSILDTKSKGDESSGATDDGVDEFDQPDAEELDVEKANPTADPDSSRIRMRTKNYTLTPVVNRQNSDETVQPDRAQRFAWPKPLPIEQREITSILVRTSKNDPYDMLGFILPQKINEGDLESTLEWSSFRPVRAQKAAQAVNPVGEITRFFMTFIAPIQWLLLALTTMICVVSGISILVGIYNSMSQRKHEIAVMRALGANRSTVMLIMLIEALLVSLCRWLVGVDLWTSVKRRYQPNRRVQNGGRSGFL